MAHDPDNNCDGAGSENRGNGDVHRSSLSIDAILSLLADSQRRNFLQLILENPGRTRSVEECITKLLDEAEAQTDERPSYDQVEIALYHSHLPRLVDAGIIEYDPRNQEIRFRRHDRLKSWLDHVQTKMEDDE